jgi:Prokaryotic membrane lipoprotein lipid attachment site.
MKKYLLVLSAVFLLSGCAFGDWFGGGSGGGRSSTSASPRQQLSDGRASFDQKIKAAAGQSLSRVQKDWGRLEQGLSRDGLTVYKWSQTARLTAPAGEVTPAQSGQETTSCLAMFIVSPDGVVVDATSEGQCYDYRLMPAWRPYILESTDGRSGSVGR